MSVSINFTTPTNVSKWEAIKSGDFAVLEGIDEHPIPNGLYRIFIVADPEPPGMRTIFITPMFDGPIPENMFPYPLNDFPLPILTQTVKGVSINVEVS